MARKTVNLFTYRDYRQFLQDWFVAGKAVARSLSFRAFAQRAGFRSPSFLKLVMDGQRNLTEESVKKISKGLRLNKQEQEFFRQLVLFNQATTHDQQRQHYKQLLQSRKMRALKPIERAQFDYYDAWYHPIVRELIAHRDFDGTAAWMAEQIIPAITIDQAARSLQLLAKLGMTTQGKDGIWRQTDRLISTGAEVASVAVMQYHRALLDVTKDVLDAVPAAQRDVSALTLGVAKARLPELKRRVQEFRREILKLVSDETHPEVVVQLDMQLFPVTKIPGEKS